MGSLPYGRIGPSLPFFKTGKEDKFRFKHATLKVPVYHPHGNLQREFGAYMDITVEAVTSGLSAIFFHLEMQKWRFHRKNWRGIPGRPHWRGPSLLKLQWACSVAHHWQFEIRLKGSIDNQILAFNSLCHYVQLCVMIKSHLNEIQ